MQAEQSVEREPLPHWLEELEQQAAEARLELEREQSAAKLAELETLLADLPGIFERKFSQRLQPVLERQQLLMEENSRLRLQVERLLPAPGEVRLRFPQGQQSSGSATPPQPDPESLPPLLRLIRGGRPDAWPQPTAEWEDPKRR
ncbi:MAG: hypothetical protein DBW85_00605 [Synechococcus sp. MED-G71]|jgi:hypothetical protein|nr:MAG: hypothetical protein DBW85_00605 [Synechococcus sp. MED-G71]|tara:strand:+ start:362 stop:796 length:435 start_codon:yes stop_codon:yes gene_type:complete